MAVALQVGCDGALLGRDVRGDAALLTRAAGRALQRAVPLPVPPPGADCPVSLDYVMVYRLR